MASIQCHIVSAEEELFAGDVELIVAAGQLGDIGVTASHAPLLTVLQPGSVKLVMKDSDDVFFYVSGGFLEIQPGKVTILADAALRADDVDEAAALEAQKEAQQSMADQNADVDYSLAAARLAEASAQLRTLQQIRKTMGK